jgi:hypothetical protein
MAIRRCLENKASAKCTRKRVVAMGRCGEVSHKPTVDALQNCVALGNY